MATQPRHPATGQYVAAPLDNSGGEQGLPAQPALRVANAPVEVLNHRLRETELAATVADIRSPGGRAGRTS
jgi:hypothetical protein